MISQIHIGVHSNEKSARQKAAEVGGLVFRVDACFLKDNEKLQTIEDDPDEVPF